MWYVAVAGLVLLVATGLLGYGIDGDDGRFQLHLLLGLGSGMLLFFAHGWIAVYLLLTGRLLRASVPAAERGDLFATVLRRGRWAVPLALLAAVAAAALVAGGVPVFTGKVSHAVHQAAFVGVVLLEVAALLVEWPLLGRHETLIRDTDRRLAAA